MRMKVLILFIVEEKQRNISPYNLIYYNAFFLFKAISKFEF